MRLFLAINLPEKVKRSLDLQIADIKREYRAFNWIPSENYHITLHFFGDVAPAARIAHILEELLYDMKSFYLYSHICDLFMNHKITLYVGFRRDRNLEIAVHTIKDYFNSKDTNKFVPHLTIARYKIPSKQQYLLLKKKLHAVPVELEFAVKKLTLFETIATTKKPTYTRVAEFTLVQ
ncbi:RNA 2',3'-cyclic phosphodiesterase [Candidatus Roizmanbacteria bacterium]|nr:RNA 2',3'-cyclic phosphodiesterase [Candidatus Roizmanbacteria bacterium]